ncbi:MAG: hypothetical protein STSR0002_15740 [Smithella sp.]|jgi:proteic killer suppression protein
MSSKLNYKIITAIGEENNQFAISINKQWRVCFEWHDCNAFNVEIIDYH